LFHVVSKRLTMRGFIVSDPGFGDKYAKEHQEKMQQWLAEGSVTARLSVTEGIDNAAEGFVGMLQGKNFGKAVLKIKDE
jgi:NADPH-dependent curcumin reductase CurA